MEHKPYSRVSRAKSPKCHNQMAQGAHAAHRWSLGEMGPGHPHVALLCSLAGNFQAMRPLQAQIVLSAAVWRHQTRLLLSGGRENGSGGGWEEGGCKGRGPVPTLSPQPPRFLHISWWVLRDALWGKFRDLNPFTSQQMRLAWKRKDPRCLLSLQKSKCSCVIF